VQARLELEHAIGHDPLTGLATRRTVLSRLARVLEDAQDTRTWAAVLCIGIDQLRDVNDAVGHAAGDVIITRIAARLAESVGDQDLVGRGGGAELLVLVPGLHDPADAAVVADRLLHAAQGEIVFNDDTTARILDLMGKRGRERRRAEAAANAGTKDKASQRSGLFTSGVVSTREGRRIALFFTGRQHAGENLKEVLLRRAEALGPPIQMCDALARNLPGELKTILANCLAHGRRQFVEVTEQFPEACRHVLESLSVAYKNDAIARDRGLSAEERLEWHQAESGPTMDELKSWLARQFDQRLVEPNSTLGGAITYLVRHWEKLTLFLRVPGAPLDNNLCERALKRSILHRKNALFYKTQRGAHVGDVFMSLIHTCELCGANPFAYLTQLARHACEAAGQPQNWMPWNYRGTLEGKGHAPTPSEANAQEGRRPAKTAPGADETHEGRVD